MAYNYNTQPQQPMQQPQYQPTMRPMSYQPMNSWNARVRPVSSIEEVRASSIDFDGSIFYFPDIANRKIYTKYINMDGSVAINIYELKEMPTGQPIDNSYITREEFERAIAQLKASYNSPASQQQSYEEQKEQNQNSTPIFQF